MSAHEHHQQRRARASSAKPAHDRPRPSSGNSSRNHKIQFIDNLYAGLFSTKRPSNSKPPSKVDESGRPRARQTKGDGQKGREELVEENLQLRREINLLKEELSLQRGKTEQMRRKQSEYTRQLNVKFGNELYWGSGGPQMVRGVKQQYQQMKLKYEQKCLQYDLLTQEYLFSQAREDRTYSDLLQEQNQKLLRRIAEAKDEMKYVQHGTLTSAVEDSIDLHKKYKFELQQQNEDLEAQLQDCRLKVKTLAEEVKFRDQKIAYLDKLLIERDNSQHAAWRKAKRIDKEKQELANLFNQYKIQKEETIANYENRIKRVRDTLEKQSETEREIFRRQLDEKSVRITKLEKEIAYLTTLLSYWKPLDEVNHLVSNNLLNTNTNPNPNSQENRSNADLDREVLLEYSMGSTMIKYNVSKHHTHHAANEEEVDTKSMVAKSRRGSGDNRNPPELMTKSIDISKKDPQRKKRTQITADKRHTEEGVKSRKVSHTEVADICETLRYRFIGLEIPIQEIRKYFDYNADVQMVEDQEEEQWSNTYITMRQVNRILQNQIFGLNESDALLLSRYLVQDSPGDYVYCDPSNQHLRSVVKSIIKTAVGDYEISPNRSRIVREAAELLEKYQTNLESALRVTAPKGLISKKKLLELFKGLGIELSEALEDYFIGKVVIKSQNLSNLRYQQLFAQ